LLANEGHGIESINTATAHHAILAQPSVAWRMTQKPHDDPDER